MTEIIIHGQDFDNPADALAHFGVKGMKWGKRKADGSGGSGGITRKEAKREVKQLSNIAGAAIGANRKAVKAGDKASSKAAIEMYQKEVMAKIKTPEFKEAYVKANTVGKGEIAVHLLALNVGAAFTIPMLYQQKAAIRKDGLSYEMTAAQNILRDMKASAKAGPRKPPKS